MMEVLVTPTGDILLRRVANAERSKPVRSMRQFIGFKFLYTKYNADKSKVLPELIKGLDNGKIRWVQRSWSTEIYANALWNERTTRQDRDYDNWLDPSTMQKCEEIWAE
jgi:hypothetical protein